MVEGDPVKLCRFVPEFIWETEQKRENKVRSVLLLEKMTHELQGKDLREPKLQKGSEGMGEETRAR